MPPHSETFGPAIKFGPISPYEIPSAVRGIATSDGNIRIEFQYIDGPESASKEVPIGEHVTISTGKHSNRLMSLGIDVGGFCKERPDRKPTSEAVMAYLINVFARAWNLAERRCNSSLDRHVFHTTEDAWKTRERDVVHQVMKTLCQ